MVATLQLNTPSTAKLGNFLPRGSWLLAAVFGIYMLIGAHTIQADLNLIKSPPSS